MVEIPDKIKDLLKNYFHLLQSNNLQIKYAYLFGSYAKGNYNDLSDIDLVIVSEEFEGNRIKDRDKIRAITLSVSSKLEVLPYSPKDFNLENPFVKEIVETGIRLI